jgi:hypothetical protein
MYKELRPEVQNFQQKLKGDITRARTGKKNPLDVLEQTEISFKHFYALVNKVPQDMTPNALKDIKSIKEHKLSPE